ncbi:DUF5671 domain-containing protein [Mesoterricola silvestris]|uniref:DUF5671 domain-containing protein n=1 Tax=Mesoterricola silvestris TaxID=2927979 RepID=A0AA48GNZ7_9BACT|nr:DUF5671 domain-containing protein [Mesoterricola silvestris]BDU73424.1 hypothetical protein METEAL_25980 [Mesoterricola silvestris]
MNAELQSFVYKALSSGHPREAIALALEEAGWSTEEIKSALHGYVDAGLGLPVPRKAVSSSPKEAFQFLLLFSSLVTWSFSLGSILFDLLNLWMPQPGEYEMASHHIRSLRTQISSVLVAFPLFMVLNHLVTAAARRNPGQRISPIRRWSTYLTLLLASVALVTDLIVLAHTFLEGEMTSRFILKTLVVAVLAGAALGHYFLQLRKDELDPSADMGVRTPGQLLLAGCVVLVLAVAFWNVGSPSRVRLQNLDARRVQDLQNIQEGISSYAETHGKLPATLADCNGDPLTYIRAMEDPETHEPYLYRILDASHFVIGATFAGPTPANGSGPGFWKHGQGPSEFQIEWRKAPSRE